MEKPKAPPQSQELLQCVGSLEIVRPKPVGFLCGSIPVPTDKAFHDFDSAALIPSAQTVQAPRYRMIPTETDLNMLPIPPTLPDKVLSVAAAESKTSGDLSWENETVTSSGMRKGEALAVSGLVEYGDEIDVIAPADILKQIFKMPYSKARLSVAVQRVGQTLVLNTGPDVEEGEKLVRRHNNQSKSADTSLFLNFAMHSVRMEACDCPPSYHTTPTEKSDSFVLPGQLSREVPFESCRNFRQGHSPCGQNHDISDDEDFKHYQEYSKIKEGEVFWRKKKSKRNKGQNAVKKVSQVKEKPRCSVKESEKYRRVNDDSFLRVLFWQFNNFRMLLGSDLLIFSNEKYVAVSLHLWDVSRQVTPLTWLEAWLDNVMASVPELAICYHQDGVVQGYELLKTEDIFLLKGISEDGTPAFHPHVVQQNGLMVLRFLQENCKHDPGAYWLYKSAGEDLIQLFDLSIMPKNHSPDDCDDAQSALPSLIHRGRSDSLLSLGTLLYRIGHRLSLSISPDKRARCVRFLRQCLDLLDEPDHLVVRAFAHEQFARLLLIYDGELDLTSETVPTDYEVTVADAEDDSFEGCPVVSEAEFERKGPEKFQKFDLENSVAKTEDCNISSNGTLAISDDPPFEYPVDVPSGQDSSVCDSSDFTGPIVQTITDPISSKMAAVHHVSQAIKSIRWKRQLQSTEVNMDHVGKDQGWLQSSSEYSVCACGDSDCIEVCDICEWLPTSKLDDKAWKLVLLLGESYLSLGQAYKDDGQLFQALKVVELACLVYGSMPQHLEDTRFISSMALTSANQLEIMGRSEKNESLTGDDGFTFQQSPSSYLFWSKAWTLVGDVYVEFHLIKDKEISVKSEKKSFTKELKMSSEVIKEVERLKKKLGQFSQNCSSCSLVNCSCRSDRANSGSSASSSSANICPSAYGRKASKKSFTKGAFYSHAGNYEDDQAHQSSEKSRYLKGNKNEMLRNTSDIRDKKTAAFDVERANITMKMENGGPAVASHSETTLRETTEVRHGGIFKYVRNPVIGDGDYNLSISVKCYEEARKALGENSSNSGEFQSVTKKKGWVCNELGRSRLERRDLDGAEIAFADAINSFTEVSDHTNIILINCNFGHGRRASAEEMVSKVETFKKHVVLHNAYKQALETAKREYREALVYYGAAKLELNVIAEDADLVLSSLKDEVYTQYAHTYLKLGMLLAREGTVAEVYENGVLEDCKSPMVLRPKKEYRKHEISANDAIREALSIYESLGELRKQEAAYAYYQLACYQRDCCLKSFESDIKNSNLSRDENQRLKQYASLADRNWQKSMDFYGPGTHPLMYLTILMERSALSLNLSSFLHSNMLLESALTRLLEARHLSKNVSFSKENPEACAKFWSQLQMVLKRMLSVALPLSAQKASINSQQTPANKSGEVGKLRELYKMSLKSSDFSELHAIHSLWTSSQ